MPSFRDTMETDYRSLDGLEAVTLRVLTSEGQFSDYALDYSLWDEDLDREMDRSAAVLRQATATATLWQADLTAAAVPEPSPKVGDQVTRTLDGTQWAVDRVNRREMGGRHDCTLRRLLTPTR